VVLKDQFLQTKMTTQGGEITLKRTSTKELLYQCKAQEAKEWIEAVLEEKLKGNFEDLIRDGVILCKLMKKYNQI